MNFLACLRFGIGVFAIVLFSQILAFQAAVAPEVSRSAMGGRTIASFQDDDFNQRLERLEQCYGVRLELGEAGVERRRSCKAIVVHKLQSMLGQGAYFRDPVRMVCRDTASGAKSWLSWDGEAFFALLPNQESEVLKELERAQLVSPGLPESKAREIQASCDKIVECRQNWGWQCLWDADAKRRQLLHENLASKFFRAPAALRPVVPRLIGQ